MFIASAKQNNPSSVGAPRETGHRFVRRLMELDGLKDNFAIDMTHLKAPPRNSLFYPSQAVLNSSVFPMSSKPKPREAELNFEGAMDRLEKIVEQMESGKLPLEDLIVRYEEGMKLVKICQERLANAEQKIEIITRNSAGKPVIKEFEPAQEPATPEKAPAESESTNDEIKLF